MKDYLIWAGEKMVRKHVPRRIWGQDWVWNCVMNYCTSHELSGDYSVEAYLAERS